MKPSLRRVGAPRRPSLAHLTHAVRAGDRGAARALRRRLLPEAIRLAVILVDNPLLALRLAGRAVDGALAPDGPVCRWAGEPRAEVMAALREQLASCEHRTDGPSRSTDERMALVVSELCDRQGRSHRQAAQHLGVPVREIDRLHGRALSDAGGPALPEPRCAGWSLVRRMPELTASEAAAARGHLGLCRRCSEAHDARMLARRRLRIAVPAAGSAAAAGGAWSALAGGASSIAGPAAGGAAAAALGGLALLGPNIRDFPLPVAPPTAGPSVPVRAVPGDRPVADLLSAHGVAHRRAGAPEKGAPRLPRAPRTAPTAGPGGAVGPLPAPDRPDAPTQADHRVPTGPVPTGPVPTVTEPAPLPTDLPVPVPSLLPLPLPTLTIADPVSVVVEAVNGAGRNLPALLSVPSEVRLP